MKLLNPVIVFALLAGSAGAVTSPDGRIEVLFNLGSDGAG